MHVPHFLTVHGCLPRCPTTVLGCCGSCGTPAAPLPAQVPNIVGGPVEYTVLSDLSCVAGPTSVRVAGTQATSYKASGAGFTGFIALWAHLRTLKGERPPATKERIFNGSSSKQRIYVPASSCAWVS
jgi:hypothetical protein